MENSEVPFEMIWKEIELHMRKRAPNSETPTEAHDLSEKETEVDDPDHQGQERFFQKWQKIFVASCVFAVLLDPLFLYIPIINDDMKCLGLDSNLKTASLIFRSFTDMFYIVDMVLRIYKSEKCSGLMEEFLEGDYYMSDFFLFIFLPTVAQAIWHSYNILIDILAILPIPQVVILIFFTAMRGSRSLLNTRRFFMNFLIVLQYVPRVLRIYLSCNELRKTPTGENTAVWVKGVLNFFLYILASHVLGAFWYFFAIQRMTFCWQSSCRIENGCNTSTFGCHDHPTFNNVTILNDLCPIGTPNTTIFDFGIYTTVLQSGILGSTNYQQKLSNCFWWGLRNLSSLGSNLEPSIDTWENLFAVIISIIGLLLFLYLIGNLQTYMQLETSRLEAYRQDRKIARKMKEKGEEIERWLSINGIPKGTLKDIKLQIMVLVREEVEQNRDIDVENIHFLLPLQLQNYIKSCSPVTILKKVPKLQNMNEEVLKAICKRLKHRSYTASSYIIREKERLEMMSIITDGLVKIESSTDTYASHGTRYFCGEELLDWVFYRAFPTVLPFSTNTAQAIGDVETLVLMADDLKTVVSMFSSEFSESDFPIPRDAFYLLGLDKLPLLSSALHTE